VGNWIFSIFGIITSRMAVHRQVLCSVVAVEFKMILHEKLGENTRVSQKVKGFFNFLLGRVVTMLVLIPLL
jgi:hypothetical protein